jgi:hypothetical protein
VDKVPTDHNIADLGTKKVEPIAKFERLRDIANGENPFVYCGPKVQEILDGKYD